MTPTDTDLEKLPLTNTNPNEPSSFSKRFALFTHAARQALPSPSLYQFACYLFALGELLPVANLLDSCVAKLNCHTEFVEIAPHYFQNTVFCDCSPSDLNKFLSGTEMVFLAGAAAIIPLAIVIYAKCSARGESTEEAALSGIGPGRV